MASTAARSWPARSTSARSGDRWARVSARRRFTASATRCCWAPSWMSRSSSRRSASCRSTSRSRDAAQLVGPRRQLGAPQLELGAQPCPAQDQPRLPGQPREQALLDRGERACARAPGRPGRRAARRRAAPRATGGPATSAIDSGPARSPRAWPRAARSRPASAGRRRPARPATTPRRCPRPAPGHPRRQLLGGVAARHRLGEPAQHVVRRGEAAVHRPRRDRLQPRLDAARTPARPRPSPAPTGPGSARTVWPMSRPPPSTTTTYTSTTNAVSPASTRRGGTTTRDEIVGAAVAARSSLQSGPARTGRGRALPEPRGWG